MHSIGIEGSLFTWEKWDQMDTMDFQFYDCTLLVNIGEYQAGDKIATITCVYSRSVLTFYDDDGKELEEFKIALMIA